MPKRISGKTLREWRRAHTEDNVPITQAEAAAWYGVHERTWRRYETGEVPVPYFLQKVIFSGAEIK